MKFRFITQMNRSGISSSPSIMAIKTNKTLVSLLDHQAAVFVPAAICTEMTSKASVQSSTMLILASGSPCWIFSASYEALTDFVNRVSFYIWASRASFPFLTDASSVAKFFVPPSDWWCGMWRTSKMPSKFPSNRYNTVNLRIFKHTPATIGW